MKVSRTAVLTVGVLAMMAPAGAAGEESIKFKNAMMAPITVLVQPERLDAPANLQIGVGDVYDYPLKYDGMYTIMVTPHDEPRSGYLLGSFDLKLLAKTLNGAPLELEGDFGLYRNRQTGELCEIRDRVHFDVALLDRPGAVRHSANRVDYGPQDEPQPAGRMAIMAVTVPEDAKVWVNDRVTSKTGQLRFFGTPALDPALENRYTVRAEWTAAGRKCVETKEVVVRPGETSRVFFKLPIEPKPVVLVVPQPAYVIPPR